MNNQFLRVLFFTLRPLWFAVAVCLLSTEAVHAQQWQPEARVDLLGPRGPSIQPGVGLTGALGYYVRVNAAAGYDPDADARWIADHWRGDLTARFLLDPFRQQRWGFSAGAGLSFRRHTYLAVLLDLEGPEMRGTAPALQVGLSGGLRGALILRRTIKGRR